MKRSIRKCGFILVPVFLFFIFSKCSNEKVITPPLIVNIELLNQQIFTDSIYRYCEDIPYEYFQNKKYEVQIDIKNNTDSVINIVLMTCSWDDNVIINTPYISYSRGDCNGNYPRMINIKPHDKQTLTTNIQKNKYIQECETCPMYSKLIDLRMGLIVITDIHSYDSIMNDKSSWNIIWSNPIRLNK